MSATNEMTTEKAVDLLPSVPSSDDSEFTNTADSNSGSSGSSTMNSEMVVKKKKKSRQSKPTLGNGKRSPKVTKEKLCALIHYISMHENDGNGALKEVVAKRAGYLSATAPAFSMAVTRQKRNGLIFECPSDNKLIDVTEQGRIIAEQSGFKTKDLLTPPVGVSWDQPPTMASAMAMAAAAPVKKPAKSKAAKSLKAKASSNAKTVSIKVTTEEHHNRIRNQLRKKCHPKALELFELLANGYARSRPEVAAFMDFDSPYAAALSFLLADMNERGIIEIKRDRTSFGVLDWVMLTDACFPVPGEQRP